MALWIVAWDDANNRLKRTTSDPNSVGVTVRAQRAALTNNTSAVAITFSTPMPSANYSLTCTMQNTTDANPQFQSVVITAQDANGFTAKWNSPLDSGNYVLNYHVSAFV